jgi:hypothetical protein
MSKLPTKQFVVGRKEDGADFTSEEIETLIYKIALWFSSDECDRKYDDPVAAARQKIQECLLAETGEGKPWMNCPKDFGKRVKAKCNYDIETGTGKAPPAVKGKNNGNRDLDPDAKAGAQALNAANPVATAFDQEGFRATYEQQILAAFPELDNPAHLPNVRSLSMYHAQREVIDRELAIGLKGTKRLELLESLQKIEQMADVTMKRLGIHPDQVRKKISDKVGSTIADFVAMVSSDADFPERNRVWALQAALQFYWMSEHYNGRKSGPQLHDFEIWHATRTRPVKFTCRHGETYTVVEGFEPHELRDFLLARGVLIEEPVIPGLFTKEDLKGLATMDLSPRPKLDGEFDGEEPNQ